MYPKCETSDLLILSRSPWGNLGGATLAPLARHRRVYYVEHALFGQTELPRYEIRMTPDLVSVVTPHLPSIIHPLNINSAMREILDDLIHEEEIRDFTLCYHHALTLSFSDHLEAALIVYDSQEETVDKGLSDMADLVLKNNDSFETKMRLEKEFRKKKRAMLYHPISTLNLSITGVI